MSSDDLQVNVRSCPTDKPALEMLKRKTDTLDSQINVLHFAISRPDSGGGLFRGLRADIDLMYEDRWSQLRRGIDPIDGRTLPFYNVDVAVACPVSRGLNCGKSAVDMLMYHNFDLSLSTELVPFLSGFKRRPLYAAELRQDFKWRDVCLKFAFYRCTPELFVKCLRYTPLSTITNQLIGLNELIADTFQPFSFVTHLLRQFAASDTSQDIRLSVLNMCTRMGCQINSNDLKVAYNIFGCGAELETLVNTGNLSWHTLEPLQQQFFSLKSFFPYSDTTYIVRAIDLLLRNCECDLRRIDTVKLFSLPNSFNMGLNDIIWVTGFLNEHLSRWNCRHVVPSLLELSRDAVRDCLIHNQQSMNMPKYLDAIKSLDIPQSLKVVLLCTSCIR